MKLELQLRFDCRIFENRAAVMLISYLFYSRRLLVTFKHLNCFFFYLFTSFLV